jgi:hypothetical protein
LEQFKRSFGVRGGVQRKGGIGGLKLYRGIGDGPVLGIVNHSVNCGEDSGKRRQGQCKQESQGKARRNSHRTNLREESFKGAGGFANAVDAMRTEPDAVKESSKSDLT